MSDTDPIKHFHSNAMQARGGAYDLTLDFGYRADQADDPEYRVRISMSWEHATAITTILQRLIEDYERQVPSISAIKDKVIFEAAEPSPEQQGEPSS